MGTTRLYYEEAYQLGFQATVIEVTEYQNKPAVILDQTGFYPEGGGQPADTGQLNGLAVLDVQEHDQKIVHVLEAPIPAGEIIQGEVDFGKRWDHMQQHSGQHILSQSFFQQAKAETIGFHLGRDNSTIDLEKDGLTEEDLFRVEVQANRIVLENRQIKSHVLPRAEALTLPLRRIPEHEDPLRIIEIEGFDINSCCGTHVLHTAEVGQIKICGTERYKGGTRVYFLCGWRALKDYQAKQKILDQMKQQLSVGEAEMITQIERWAEDRKVSKKKLKALQIQLDDFQVEELLNQSESVGQLRLVTHIFEDAEPGSKKNLVQKLIQRPNVLVLLGIRSDKVSLIMGRSDNIDLDIRPVLQQACSWIEGKGGGGVSFGQASGLNQAGLKKALETARESVLSVIQQS